MTNFIPIFPLGVVVYPGENLNLHIFESRYIQLINESNGSKRPFGIPVVMNEKVEEYGTLVAIEEMSKVHDNGEIDIKTKGVKVFRILEVIREVPDKLYSGAIVNYPENYEKTNPDWMRKVMNSIRDLHKLLKVNKEFKKEDGALTCYDVAHDIGLSLREEYEFLCLFDERQRLEYIKRHLTKIIPMAAGMEQLKEKIKGNGHFKNLPGIDV